MSQTTAPKLIKRPAVQELTQVSRSSLYLMMSKGEFPKPIKLGSKSVAWLESEIFDWVNARIALRGEV